MRLFRAPVLVVTVGNPKDQRAEEEIHRKQVHGPLGEATRLIE